MKKLLIDLENHRSKVDMVLLCETFLSDQMTQLVNVPGYSLISNHRKSHKGGGTAILIHDEMTYKRRLDLTVFKEKEFESMFIKIVAKNGKGIVVGSMYRPPNSKENEFTTALIDILHKIKSKRKEIILGMDHNLDLLKSAHHKATQRFLDELLGLNILPTTMHQTRIMHSSATLIDNIFVSDHLYRDFESALILNDISDHLPLLMLLEQTKFVNKQPLEFPSRSLNEKTIKEIKERLYKIDWIGLLNKKMSNENFNMFCKKVKDTMDLFHQKKSVRISYKRKFVEPWMSHAIEKSSKWKMVLHKVSFKANATEKDIQDYKIYRNEYNRLKRTARINWYSKKIEDCKTKTRELWQVMNEVIGKVKHRGSIISHITTDGIKTYNP